MELPVRQKGGSFQVGRNVVLRSLRKQKGLAVGGEGLRDQRRATALKKKVHQENNRNDQAHFI